jgi:sulfane dehydrogenase subunit SoxC
MDSEQSARRRFLRDGAALAGLAVGGIPSASAQTPTPETPAIPPQDARAYGERSRFETAARRPVGGKWNRLLGRATSLTPLQDLTGIITPAPFHFDTAKGHPPPDIDPREHRLLIHGMVDRPLIFTLEELKRLPSVSRVYFLECASNGAEGRGLETVQLTHGKTSCSEWTGVLLSVLLKEAGLQSRASWIVAEGAEVSRHTRSIPLRKAMEDIIVAYAQNGEAVRPENGYPLRLVIPGWIGNINVKWLRRIKVVDQPHMTMFESTQYVRMKPDGKSRWFLFEQGPKSVITSPSGGQRLPSRGFYELSGLAWSGGGAVRKVEVSTDGGRTWKDAQVQEPVFRFAHTRFRFPWNWNGEEVVLQSRCTDELGQVQPTLAQMSELWGVNLDYWQSDIPMKEASTSPPYAAPTINFNAIQSWKVTREGSVQNALFS